ncbi:unnamed protein product [Paramecium octaurelia]|uniref:Uncharacterized protein n=1 Tax=Paramecium octaurelia TaxID=43137 RepID=A0A8S1YPI0_PAROT|nr:unnamed protein product [Paramecium octaurelia]
MAEGKINTIPFNSDKLKFDTNTPSLDQMKKVFEPIKPYNYNCQLDQYNVKLCGVVFDAIGEPDFIMNNDNLESEIDTIE